MTGPASLSWAARRLADALPRGDAGALHGLIDRQAAATRSPDRFLVGAIAGGALWPARRPTAEEARALLAGLAPHLTAEDVAALEASLAGEQPARRPPSWLRRSA